MAKTKKAETQIDADAAPVKEVKIKLAGVAIDPPNTPLIPGNTVTFVAKPPKFGRQEVKIETDRGSWLGVPSVSSGQARQSLGLESGHGEITVTFYEDGKAYASGKYEV